MRRLSLSNVSHIKKDYYSARYTALSKKYLRYLFTQLLGEYAVYMSEFVTGVATRSTAHISETSVKLGKWDSDFHYLMSSFCSDPSDPSYSDENKQMVLDASENIRGILGEVARTATTNGIAMSNQVWQQLNSQIVSIIGRLVESSDCVANGYWRGPVQKEIKTCGHEFMQSLQNVVQLGRQRRVNGDAFYKQATVFIQRARILGTLLDQVLQ